MLWEMTKEEELKHRRNTFAQLRPGSLFNLELRYWFVAVKKVADKEWEVEVIELTESNRLKIVTGQACEVVRLHFDNMNCLNLQKT